jgi:amino acid transporter
MTLESDIDRRSSAFKKELGLRDLVLTQVLFIVGLGWVGTAARLGPSHVVFWLLAIVFFYLPSAAVVIHLNRLMPLEGGLYQAWLQRAGRLSRRLEPVGLRDRQRV